MCDYVVFFPYDESQTKAAFDAFSRKALTDQQTRGVAIFTLPRCRIAVLEPTSDMSIAYSNDRGRTFTYYKNNPVLKHPGRDPKVIWFEPGEHWVMAVYDDTPAIGPNTAFYSSKNLKDWRHESNLRGRS